MRDHELELIADLVEGRLTDEAEARALVESSPEFRAEYEAQKMAYEALRSIGTVSLSETERAALHRDVWTELRAAQKPSPAKAPWYYRWVPALAGMFVVVGLVAVVSQGGGDDSSEEALAQFSVTTEAGGAASDGGVADTGAEPEGDAGAEASEGGESQEEGVEEAETTSQPMDEARSLTAPAASFYSAEAAMVRSGALEEPDGEDAGAAPSDSLAPCLEAANLAGYVPLATLTSPIQSDELDLEGIPVPSESNPVIVAIPEGADISSAVVAFVDQGDCHVIHLDQEQP